MTVRYEDRHHELVEAEEATRRAKQGMTPAHGKADFMLRDFEARTGPAVDELVAAVRELEAFDGSVVVEGAKAGEWLRLNLAVSNALAALDEAAAR